MVYYAIIIYSSYGGYSDHIITCDYDTYKEARERAESLVAEIRKRGQYAEYSVRDRDVEK